jgi:STE24 endopeptidase
LNEDRAARYHRLRRRAGLLSIVAAAGLLLSLVLTGASLYLREIGSIVGALIGRGFEEPGTVVGFALALSILLHIIELPFAFYQGYLLEHRYGLSNQSLKQWAGDHTKGFVISTALAVLGASLVYATMRWNADWWWAASAALLAIAMIGIVQLAPVLLLPLFYRFKPLDRPALVDRLLALAARAETRVVGVYEWVLSAHTKKANAALAGMGRTRRILLADTLLADYSDDEIAVILAHELSHHVHHDLWRGMAMQAVLLFVGFLAAHVTLVHLAGPLALRGMDDPAGMPLLLLVGGVCSFAFMPVANALSRTHERRADRFALEMTHDASAFISAMKRLSQQNLAEERPSRLVQWLFYSHPPIRARVEAARTWATQHPEGRTELA